jgi:peptidoglycan/xylan/chitin deacetylase (PgdA/CDA1 family)
LPWTLAVARELGLTPVMWNVTGYDWSPTTGAVIEQKVMRQAARHGEGDVILLHDGGHKQMGAERGHSVDATERILQRYKLGEGREFVTAGDVLGQ